MTKETTVGRILTPDEGIAFFERCIAAEKVMGELSLDERVAILNTLGSPITVEELADLVQGKRVLVVKEKPNA